MTVMREEIKEIWMECRKSNIKNSLNYILEKLKEKSIMNEEIQKTIKN